MKLSQLTPEQKTRLLAELDDIDMSPIPCSHKYCGMDDCGNTHYPDHPDYPTSYDAIIPLAQKLWSDPSSRLNIFSFDIMMTPSQLCDAVLVATGKAEL